MRTEGRSPRSRAVAVGVGTLIGCLPLYGLHLILCFGIARLLGVSRAITYLAAHVNNPVTSLPLLYVEVVTGQWIRTRSQPALTLEFVRTTPILDMGIDLALGSVVVGVVLGLILGAVTWAVALRWRSSGLASRLRDEAARPYLPCGVSHWEFVRGKLRFDPLYFGLLRSGVLPRRGRLLDLGCGRGILQAVLLAASEAWHGRLWDEDWPAPPRGLVYVGVDARSAAVRVARTALADRAEIQAEDLRRYRPGPADVVVCADTLHYLEPDEQVGLLTRVVESLAPGGLLLVREADADGSLRFLLTRLQERVRATLRGTWRQRFHYRGVAEWRRLLEGRGLVTRSSPLWAGTPYANVLIEARKPGGSEHESPRDFRGAD